MSTIKRQFLCSSQSDTLGAATDDGVFALEGDVHEYKDMDDG
jgi:hypothetical protein